MEPGAKIEDLEKEEQELQSEMDVRAAEHSRELEDLRASRDTEVNARSRTEERCLTIQTDLDKANGEGQSVMEKLIQTTREVEVLRAEKTELVLKFEALETRLKFLRPEAAPTVELQAPLPPEVQSAGETPVFDVPASVLNED